MMSVVGPSQLRLLYALGPLASKVPRPRTRTRRGSKVLSPHTGGSSHLQGHIKNLEITSLSLSAVHQANLSVFTKNLDPSWAALLIFVRAALKRGVSVY